MQVVGDDPALAEILAGPPRVDVLPGPGVGVLLKKLRSRWLVFDPTYWMSSAVPRHSSRCRSKLHWSLRAFGRSRVGEMMSGRPAGPTRARTAPG